MRAQLDASLCSPEDRPVSVTVDETSADIKLTGSPKVSLPPLELELPTVQVTPPSVTVQLPTPKLTIQVGVSADNAISYLKKVRDFIDEILDPANASLGNAAIALPTLQLVGLLPVLASLGISVAVKLETGSIVVSAGGPLTVTTGKLRLHAVPAQGDDLPVELSADLDDTAATAEFGGLKATLAGCLVLNGGEPPPPPPPPPALIERVAVQTDPDKKLVRLRIHGQGFGASRGQGHVELRDANSVFVPSQYDAWTDSEVVVVFQPTPPPGPYSLLVTTDRGSVTPPVPVTLP